MDPTTQLSAKLEMSEEDLLIEIGRNVGMYEAVPPDHVAAEEGQRWFDAHYKRLKEVICTCTVRRSLDAATKDVGIALIGCLEAAFGGVGAATVAALLIKKGVRTMCGWT